MYKSLLEKFFTGKQLEVLKTRMWWVADQNKPFLVKFAIEGEFALIRIDYSNKNLPISEVYGLLECMSRLYLKTRFGMQNRWK